MSAAQLGIVAVAGFIGGLLGFSAAATYRKWLHEMFGICDSYREMLAKDRGDQ